MQRAIVCLLSDMSDSCDACVFLSAILPMRMRLRVARALRLAEVVVYMWHTKRRSVQSNFVLQSQSVRVPC